MHSFTRRDTRHTHACTQILTFSLSLILCHLVKTDETKASVTEGRVARVACPDGMIVASSKATFGDSECGVLDVSDTVDDLCLHQAGCAISVAQELFPLAPPCSNTRVLQASITCKRM